LEGKDMNPRRARHIAHGLWLGTALLLLAGLILVSGEDPGEALLGLLLGLPIAMYGTVGALVARRRPDNPIGWLFVAVAMSLAVWMFGFAYASFGSGVEGFGSLPGGAVATWIGILTPVAVLCVALPTFLLVFPDGRLRSSRWRLAVGTAALGSVFTCLGMTATIDRYAGGLPLAAPGWAARIPTIGGFTGAGLAFVTAAALAGLVSLAARFREAEGERRHQLRLLLWLLVAMAVAPVLVIPLAWFGLVLVFLVDGGGILLGIPAATAVAVFTFGLYDVGIVVKKTIVYGLLVVLLTLLAALVVFVLSPIGLLGAGAGGSEVADGQAVAVRLVFGLTIAALATAATWRLVRRIARRIVYGKRATPYEAMAEFSERLGETYATEDVLPRMAEIVRASTGADVARVWLHIERAFRPVASAPNDASPADPVLISVADDVRVLPDLYGERTFPVRHRGELLGALTVSMPAAEPLSKMGEKLVTDLAAQAGLVLRNVRLIEELQESRRRIVAAQDERARKLERDLHDGAQQQLVALSIKLGLAEQLATRDADRAATLLGELKVEASEALENLRDLARGIYPPLLADRGLAEAIGAQARKSPIQVKLDADGLGRYPQEMEAAIYFCCLEALQNVAKYANATNATVVLNASNGHLTFSITDDGAGFDPATILRGSGLANMRDRLEALGGTFEVSSRPGQGTNVMGRIPVDAQ
jgi:signal transduction histidine kinase